MLSSISRKGRIKIFITSLLIFVSWSRQGGRDCIGTVESFGVSPLFSTVAKRGQLYVEKDVVCKKQMAVKQDDQYFSTVSASSYTKPFSDSATTSGGSQKVTLTRYLTGIVQEEPELRELESLLLSVSMACKTISNLINRGNINSSLSSTDDQRSMSSSSSYIGSLQQNSMKNLDKLSTIVLQNALRFTGKVATIAPARDNKDETSSSLERVVEYDDGPSEHQPGVLIASAIDSKYVAFFDPLDGSGNADATICTGTIFGMFESIKGDECLEQDGKGNTKKVGKNSSRKKNGSMDPFVRSVLQPGKNLRAAGYCLYSSATILVFSVGNGTLGFTLDPQLGEFVLTHPSIRIPSRGTIYSCNEANSDTWSKEVQTYLSALKSGNNESKKRYTQRYVGSMVGDLHRTLMYGGIFFYPEDQELHPRGNLQLLYKSAPLAYLVAQAGGKSTNGKTNLLEVQPERVHVRSPCFLGSRDDIKEMKTYVRHDDMVFE